MYAISCTAHPTICQLNNIRTYPTIRLYTKGSSSGYEEILNESISFNSITIALGMTTSTPNHNDNDDPSIIADKNKKENDQQHTTSTTSSSSGTIDILGAALDVYRRTKTDVYNDAAVSFMYSITNDAFLKSHDKDLLVSCSKEELKSKISAFSEWIDLLYWSLPPSWKVHTIVNDIRANVPIHSVRKHELSQIVENHKEFILHDTSGWSQSCSNHEDENWNFTCGFWNLVHIVSVGVAERHTTVLGDKLRVSTSHAAQTVRNYIQYFLGCNACTAAFLQLYNTKNSEERFIQQHSPYAKTDEKYWRDFAIWLWEVHNEINVKKLEETHSTITEKDSDLVIWPSQKDCPLCKLPNNNGTWDHMEVYNFLKSQYWYVNSMCNPRSPAQSFDLPLSLFINTFFYNNRPKGVHNFKFIVLDKKGKELGAETIQIQTKLEWTMLYTCLTTLGCAALIAFFLLWNNKQRG